MMHFALAFVEALAITYVASRLFRAADGMEPWRSSVIWLVLVGLLLVRLAILDMHA